MTALSRKEVRDRIADNKLISIINTQGLKTSEQIIELVKAHRDVGCKVVEFVLFAENTTSLVNKETIAAIKKEMPDMLVGFGTCITPEDIDFVKDVGADFAVSPFFSWRAVEQAYKKDVLYLPGVGDPDRAQQLITEEERSPHSGKSIHQLLGGDGFPATLKLHPNGNQLVWQINRLLQSPHQKKAKNFPFVALEPSDTLDGLPFKDFTKLAKAHNVVALGTTGAWLHKRNGEDVSLLTSKDGGMDIDAIKTMVTYSMDLAHGRTPQKLPFAMQYAGIQPEDVGTSKAA